MKTKKILNLCFNPCLMSACLMTLTLTAQAGVVKPVPTSSPSPDTGIVPVQVKDDLPIINYWGGPVVERARVQVVFWGDGVEASVKSKIDDFMTALVDSTYFDFLGDEYHTVFPSLNGYPGTQQHIHRGTYLGSKKITPLNKNALIDDSASQYQVSAEIKHQIDIGALPANGPNVDYIIFLPANVNVTAEFGQGISDWCAYHGAAPKPNGNFVNYAVIPDFTSALAKQNCVNGLGKGEIFKTVTYGVSGMLAAGVTDPHVAPAGTSSGGQPPETWIANDGESELYAACAYPDTLYTHLVDGAKKYLIAPLYSRSKAACITKPYKAH